jgi:hypothetical protein
MSLENVAINDGCMAGLIFRWNPVFFLEFVQLTVFYCICLKTELFQVITPAFAAASARGLVNLDGRQFLLAIGNAGWHYECGKQSCK